MLLFKNQHLTLKSKPYILDIGMLKYCLPSCRHDTHMHIYTQTLQKLATLAAHMYHGASRSWALPNKINSYAV